LFENFVGKAFPVCVFEIVRRTFSFVQLSLSEPRQQEHGYRKDCKTHCHCHTPFLFANELMFSVAPAFDWLIRIDKVRIVIAKATIASQHIRQTLFE
jgi:hypothetical protein